MRRDYGRPPRRMPPNRYDDGSMSIGQWIGTFIILAIPIVGQIAFLVWLFGGGKNRTRINYIRASVILVLIVGAIGVALYFAIGSMVMNYINNLSISANIQSIWQLYL